MALQNICDLFDSYFIADKQDKLNIDYLASSTQIYSDGEFDQHVGSDENVHISNLNGASYIMFLDQNKNIFIAIYRYIYDGKYKEIVDQLNKLRKFTGINKHEKSEKVSVENKNDIVDINTFKCPDCDSDMIWSKPYKDSDTIVSMCKKCNIEYALIPSKYYVIKAKKRLYKSNNNFRNINLGGIKNGDN